MSAVIIQNKPLTFATALLFLFSAAFTISACETITEIDLPEEKPQLVVNAIFNADSLVNVNLTESKPVNNTSLKYKPVENASIEVFKNSTSRGFLKYEGKGNYRSAAKLAYEPNTQYRLKVTATGFETAEAVEVKPGKPVLTSFNITPDYEKSNLVYKSYKAGLTLNDANGENYYFLRIWLVHPGNLKSATYFRLNNNLGQFGPPFMPISEMVLFDDKTFSNKAITLDLDIIQAYIPREGDYRMVIEVGSTTKTYFDYQFSVKKQIDEDPLFGSSENPVSNNIKNGLGIFAPYHSAAVSFDVVR